MIKYYDSYGIFTLPDVALTCIVSEETSILESNIK